MKEQNKQGEDGRNLSGPKIKEIRESLGMTQRQLVEKLKKLDVSINACTLSKMETTKRGITDIELVAFSEALEVSVDVLVKNSKK